MGEQEYLESYNGQNIDELLELEKKYEAYEILFVLELALDKKKESEKELNKEEQTVLAVQGLEREVNNGGFKQFFYNSSVEFTPIIVNSLKDITCFITADLAHKAIQCLGIDTMEIDKIEDRALTDDDEMDLCFEKLDSIFYENEEDISGKLFKFIKENKNAFLIP